VRIFPLRPHPFPSYPKPDSDEHSIYGICPKSDPNLLSIVGADASDIFDVESPSLRNGECSSALSAYDCSSLGFTGLGVPFMTSVETATFGTETLSTTNSKTLTSPISGETFSWTDLSVVYTITAAKAAAGGASTGGVTTDAGTTATTGAAGLSSGSVASATSSSKNGAGQQEVEHWLMFVGVLVALLVAWT
jgi:hypothetical protein